MADVVYIPIFDQLVGGGVQGVLEVMVHSDATDPMVMPNAITFVGTLLSHLQVSSTPNSLLPNTQLLHCCLLY